jgi:hypothetical protein
MPVMVDHNYPLTDALRAVAPNGDPVAGAEVRIYDLTAFEANNIDTWVGMTTTDIEGRWVDPIVLPDARSWVVHFQKYSEYGPVHVEITT